MGDSVALPAPDPFSPFLKGLQVDACRGQRLSSAGTRTGGRVESPVAPASMPGRGWFIQHKRQPSSQTGACMHAKWLQSCPTLCDPRDCSPPGSSVPGILQARILCGLPFPSSRGSSQPRDQICVSCILSIGRQVLYH